MTGHSTSILFAKELYASPSGKEQAVLFSGTETTKRDAIVTRASWLPRGREIMSAHCPPRLPLAEAIVQVRTGPAYELRKEFLPLTALSASAVLRSRVSDSMRSGVWVGSVLVCV